MTRSDFRRLWVEVGYDTGCGHDFGIRPFGLNLVRVGSMTGSIQILPTSAV